MYHVIKNGVEIGCTERLAKAIKQSNGCTVLNSKGNLLAFAGNIYNVDGDLQTDGFESVIVVWHDDVPGIQMAAGDIAETLANFMYQMDVEKLNGGITK